MPTTASMSLPLPSAPDDNRFRLLLVEDDEAAARLILGFLERTGFDCHHAIDAETAMAAFNQLKPHLLLCEFSSDQIDGGALCRWTREKSGIPIMVFGPGEEGAEVAAFKLGADDYLPQPLHPAILMARVVASLRRAYRYNTPAKTEDPFDLGFDSETTAENTGILPSGWAQCDACDFSAPRAQFEKKNVFDEIKMQCPNCKSTERIIFSLD